MTSEQTSRESSFFRFLKNLAEASVLLGAGLFLIGWSYLYSYYRAFGLSADSLNFSVDTVLVHAIPVMEATAFRLLFTGTLLVLLIAGSFRASARWLSKPAFV